MIDTLLKKDLPQAYGITRPEVLLTHRQETDVFELGDQTACTKCKAKNSGGDACNEKVMKVDATDMRITVVDHEAYINQFSGKKIAEGKRCDFLMFDDIHRKVVFCDLGCYSEEYVAKKQREVHRQVSDSMSRLLRKTCGQDFINQFSEKILIFGRRDPNLDFSNIPVPTRGNVKGNMQSFMATPFSRQKYAVSHEVVEGVDVSFVVVNYPEPYSW